MKFSLSFLALYNILFQFKYVNPELQAYFSKIASKYYAYVTNVEDPWTYVNMFGCQGGDLMSLESTRNSDVRDFIRISGAATSQMLSVWIQGICDDTNNFCSTWDSDASGYNWKVGYPRDVSEFPEGTTQTYIALDKASGFLVNTDMQRSDASDILVTEYVCEFSSLDDAKENSRFEKIPFTDEYCFFTTDDADPVCLCDERGPHCDSLVDSRACDSAPCIDGTCTSEKQGFSCMCFDGFTGITCEMTINYCTSLNPCSTDETCLNNQGSYTCVPAAGADVTATSVAATNDSGRSQSKPIEGSMLSTPGAVAFESSSGGNSTIGVIIGLSIAISLIAFVTYIACYRKRKARQHKATDNAGDASVASMSDGSFSSIMDMSMSSMGDLDRSNRKPRIAFRQSVTAYSSSSMSVTDS